MTLLKARWRTRVEESTQTSTNDSDSECCGGRFGPPSGVPTSDSGVTVLPLPRDVTMPRNRMNRSATVDDEEPSEGHNSPRSDRPISIPPIKIYPSVYLGGRDVVEFQNKVTFASVVCQEWYSHLSPEVRYYTFAKCLDAF